MNTRCANVFGVCKKTRGVSTHAARPAVIASCDLTSNTLVEALVDVDERVVAASTRAETISRVIRECLTTQVRNSGEIANDMAWVNANYGKQQQCKGVS